MLNLNISGKTALITGANNPHGTGAAIAKTFAGQGVRVFLQYYRTPWDQEIPRGFGVEYYQAMQARTADRVVEEIRAGGGQADSMEADLGDPDQIPALFSAAERAFGPVQILINNAAHSIPDTFLPGVTHVSGERGAGGLGLLQETMTPESIDRHFAVNTRGTALMMAEFARRHIARRDSWGRIVNVSTDGAAGFAGEVSYGASKYAIESLSRAAAVELGRHGITVNIASYGAIQTGWMSPELEAAVIRDTPLGRFGTPADVADAMLLLVSDQARWLTGQLIFIGGGHRMT